MNRMEEYEALRQELEEMCPDIDTSISKARKRRSRKKNAIRSVTGLAVVVVLFVMLVNFSAPVANACSQIPILRRLAEAVTFSQSLSNAVEHEYVQVMDLTQTDNGLTATIEYLIADKKKVYIFFSLDTDSDEKMLMNGDVSFTHHRPFGRDPKGLYEETGGIFLSWFHFSKLENGLWMVSVEFDNPYIQIMPKEITLNLQAYPLDDAQVEYFWQLDHLGEPAASFSFDLEFDSQKIAPAKMITVNQPLRMDGQSFMLEKVEIYPTYMHICLSEDPNNTKYLAGLNFYVEAENGMRFETSQISTGGPWESYLSYELTSPYFYDIEKMDMVVSDAVWTDKEKQKAYVDLAANTAEGLPDGWSFVSAEEQEGERILILREERENHLIELDFRGYDPEGKEWHMQMTLQQGETNADGDIACDDWVIRLKDYPYDTLWLNFKHRSRWTADTPIRIPIE